MSQDTEGSLSISRYYRVDYFFGDEPFVDLDNRFAVVLATESVVEDSHDVSEGSLSPVIGDIHSTQCSSGLFFWRLTFHMILFVDMGVRVDDVPDAGIVSSVRGSSVGVGKR
jgi:hypothetical protein